MITTYKIGVNINRRGNILTYRLTYLLSSWSRALLEKLTGFKQVKKFQAFYGTRL
jgi:hypothetical protein